MTHKLCERSIENVAKRKADNAAACLLEGGKDNDINTKYVLPVNDKGFQYKHHRDRIRCGTCGKFYARGATSGHTGTQYHILHSRFKAQAQS